MRRPLKPDSFYEFDENEVTKCGECWTEDIEKTERGEYTGDEAVLSANLRLLNDDFAYQCDGCNKQNEAYQNLDQFDEE